MHPRVKSLFCRSTGKEKISSISSSTSALKIIILSSNNKKKHAKEPLRAGPTELSTAQKEGIQVSMVLLREMLLLFVP